MSSLSVSPHLGPPWCRGLGPGLPMRRGSVPVDSQKAPTRRYQLGIKGLGYSHSTGLPRLPDRATPSSTGFSGGRLGGKVLLVVDQTSQSAGASGGDRHTGPCAGALEERGDQNRRTVRAVDSVADVVPPASTNAVSAGYLRSNAVVCAGPYVSSPRIDVDHHGAGMGVPAELRARLHGEPRCHDARGGPRRSRSVSPCRSSLFLILRSTLSVNTARSVNNSTPMGGGGACAADGSARLRRSERQQSAPQGRSHRSPLASCSCLTTGVSCDSGASSACGLRRGLPMGRLGRRLTARRSDTAVSARYQRAGRAWFMCTCSVFARSCRLSIKRSSSWLPRFVPGRAWIVDPENPLDPGRSGPI